MAKAKSNEGDALPEELTAELLLQAMLTEYTGFLQIPLLIDESDPLKVWMEVRSAVRYAQDHGWKPSEAVAAESLDRYNKEAVAQFKDYFLQYYTEERFDGQK